MVTLSTIGRNHFVDITERVKDYVEENSLTDGMVVIFIPHTTAGVTINENADPDVKTDFLNQLDQVIPWNNHYKHFEGNTAAHIKASMMGSSATVLVEKGKLVLGTWQGIYFTEFDGPRQREFYIKGYVD
jgi:secondary thiamine-phosphate synthase enzyme